MLASRPHSQLVSEPHPGFDHEAYLYRDEEDFVAGLLAFLAPALERRAPALAVLAPHKIRLMREALGERADLVEFADMGRLGANPAWIIPAWQEFLDRHPGEEVWGIGEPIDAARAGEELVECHRHEALLNVAFGQVAGFRLLCPYDVRGLEPTVIEDARRTHPTVARTGRRAPSPAYGGDAAMSGAFAAPLPPAPAAARSLAFDATNFGEVRRTVAEAGRLHGLDHARGADLLVAVQEVATNSVRHGGGSGDLRVWTEHESLVCEVADGGHIDDPLAGRRQPDVTRASGYGLWIATQVCDLVQIRSGEPGTIVRLHMSRHAPVASDAEEPRRLEALLDRRVGELQHLAAAAAHDLRDPIQTVIGFGMLLRDRAELPDHLVTHLDAILAAGQVMGEIVTELSVLAEAGAPRHPSPVPVAVVLEEVLQALAGPLADSGAMVLRDCDPTVAVLSDGLTMRRVLQNLIGNAIKHSDRDTPEVTVSARREGDRVAVAVADDGPGVPSADRERIFGAFERGALPSTEGSGLGLAICRKLVERDGGTLTVEPRAPRGSLFAVRLPAG